MKKLGYAIFVFVIIMMLPGVSAAGIDGGPVAYYPFNGNAMDESGNGHDGSVFGAELTADRFGIPDHAYDLTDFGDYIEIMDAPELDLVDEISIALWIKTLTIQDDFARILSRENSGMGNRQYNVGFDETGRFPRTVVDTLSASNIELIGTTDVSDGKWHFIVVTFDKNGAFKLHVDGVVEDGVHVDSALVSRPSNVVIGRAAHNPNGQEYSGLVDDVRIFDYVLSWSEIRDLYRARPADVSGCLDMQGFPVEGIEVVLKQPDVPRKISITDTNGCYEFHEVVPGKVFNIKVLGPVFPYP